MFRGTTPTYTFTLPNTVDLTEAESVYVTFNSTYLVDVFILEYPSGYPDVFDITATT